MMKTTFKKFMGVDRPFEPKPLPPPKQPHPVPKGYKRVKDGSFNKLVKIDEVFAPHPYSTHLLNALERGMYSKAEVMKVILKKLKDYGGDDSFGSLTNLIKVFRDAGHKWPEFDAIERSLKEETLDEISLKHAAAATVLGASMLAPKHTAHATDVNPRRQTFSQMVAKQAEMPKLDAKEEKAVNQIVKRYGVNGELAAKVVQLAQKYEHPEFPKAKDILAIVGIESSFNPKAKSGLKKDPAVGLMQFRPSAWKVADANDVETQIKKGAEILNTYYRHLFSHKDRAIQAYNIGLAKYKEARDNPEENQEILDAQKRYLDKYNREVVHYEL